MNYKHPFTWNIQIYSLTKSYSFRHCFLLCWSPENCTFQKEFSYGFFFTPSTENFSLLNQRVARRLLPQETPSLITFSEATKKTVGEDGGRNLVRVVRTRDRAQRPWRIQRAIQTVHATLSACSVFPSKSNELISNFYRQKWDCNHFIEKLSTLSL